jgi:hypothetical protein
MGNRGFVVDSRVMEPWAASKGTDLSPYGYEQLVAINQEDYANTYASSFGAGITNINTKNQGINTLKTEIDRTLKEKIRAKIVASRESLKRLLDNDIDAWITESLTLIPTILPPSEYPRNNIMGHDDVGVVPDPDLNLNQYPTLNATVLKTGGDQNNCLVNAFLIDMSPGFRSQTYFVKIVLATMFRIGPMRTMVEAFSFQDQNTKVERLTELDGPSELPNDFFDILCNAFSENNVKIIVFSQGTDLGSPISTYPTSTIGVNRPFKEGDTVLAIVHSGNHYSAVRFSEDTYSLNVEVANNLVTPTVGIQINVAPPTSSSSLLPPSSSISSKTVQTPSQPSSSLSTVTEVSETPNAPGNLEALAASLLLSSSALAAHAASTSSSSSTSRPATLPVATERPTSVSGTTLQIVPLPKPKTGSWWPFGKGKIVATAPQGIVTAASIPPITPPSQSTVQAPVTPTSSSSAAATGATAVTEATEAITPPVRPSAVTEVTEAITPPVRPSAVTEATGAITPPVRPSAATEATGAITPPVRPSAVTTVPTPQEPTTTQATGFPSWATGLLLNIKPNCKINEFSRDCADTHLAEEFNVADKYAKAGVIPGTSYKLETYNAALTELNDEQDPDKREVLLTKLNRSFPQTKDIRVINDHDQVYKRSLPNPYRAHAYRRRVTDWNNPTGITDQVEEVMKDQNLQILKDLVPPEIIADKDMSVAILESLWYSGQNPVINLSPEYNPSVILGKYRERQNASLQRSQSDHGKEFLKDGDLEGLVKNIKKLRGMLKGASYGPLAAAKATLLVAAPSVDNNVNIPVSTPGSASSSSTAQRSSSSTLPISITNALLSASTPQASATPESSTQQVSAIEATKKGPTNNRPSPQPPIISRTIVPRTTLGGGRPILPGIGLGGGTLGQIPSMRSIPTV